jgi:hypothetical protein
VHAPQVSQALLSGVHSRGGRCWVLGGFMGSTAWQSMLGR